MSLFEKAARTKLRFASSVGYITVEDLWDLPLTSKNKPNLNDVAKAISRELKNHDEEDFVGTGNPETTALNLSMDIVKHVIKVRQEENEAKNSAKITEQKREKVREILGKKRDAALEDLSEEELEAML